MTRVDDVAITAEFEAVVPATPGPPEIFQTRNLLAAET